MNGVDQSLLVHYFGEIIRRVEHARDELPRIDHPNYEAHKRANDAAIYMARDALWAVEPRTAQAKDPKGATPK